MNLKNHSSQKSLYLFLASLLLLASLNSKAQSQASAAIDGYPSGTQIPKSIFNSLPNIGVYVKPTVFEMKYQVISYTLKIADDEGGVKQITCQGSRFSTLAKQAINDYAKPGDAISIQNIKAKGEGGVEVKVPALLYYIE